MSPVPRVVRFSAPRTVAVVDEMARPLGGDEVRVRTLFSGISAGTELTAFRGTNPYLARQWDDGQRLFRDGAGSIGYPIDGWGYEEVGEVVELGAELGDRPGIAVGDRVWGTWGHRSETVLAATSARRRILDPSVDPRIGMFSQMGGIALNVVLDADIHIGETVAVFGLGVPGQLAAQLARLNGGRVIGIDGVPSRRELARSLGAEAVLDPADGGVAERIRDLTDGRGADVCLEITGSHVALHEAIRSVAYSSRVCVAGFMQGDGVGLRLGEEFHHNRVQLVGSQISGVAPALQHRWDRERLDATAISLAVAGRLAVTQLITRTFPLEAAAEAFALLDQGAPDELQVVLEVEPALT